MPFRGVRARRRRRGPQRNPHDRSVAFVRRLVIEAAVRWRPLSRGRSVSRSAVIGWQRAPIGWRMERDDADAGSGARRASSYGWNTDKQRDSRPLPASRSVPAWVAPVSWAALAVFVAVPIFAWRMQ